MATQLEFTSPLAPPLPLLRFSVAQYHMLGELGVLTPEDKVELLEGWIVEKRNQRPVHGYFVGFLSQWFQSCIPEGYIMRCQLPITTERSEPEPDIAIVSGGHHDFRNSHPSGKDCRLVIEVSDTSLDKDRAKAAIYESSGVDEYWIVNINGKCIEQYRFYESSHGLSPVIFTSEMQAMIQINGQELILPLAELFK
jgi:Uma2 family endonuclease